MAGKRWIRLDVGCFDSDWVGGLDDPAARLAWVEMLIYVKRDGSKGVVKEITAAAFGRKARIPPAAVTAMLEAAHKDGAICTSDGCWAISNWKQYQEIDKTAKDRQRRHRKSRYVTRDNGSHGEKGCDPSRDMDIDIDKKKKKPSVSKKKAGTPLPEEWQTNDTHTQLAVRLNLDLNEEIEKFCDHARANSRVQVDWNASFRNWLRNSKNFTPKHANGNGNGRKGGTLAIQEYGEGTQLSEVEGGIPWKK